MSDKVEEMSFEEALARLDEIVARMEAGELTLEESLALFEQGQSLSTYCVDLLDRAELRVEALTADGEIVAVQQDHPD